VAIAHRGIFAGRDPIALSVGRMTVALRRSHARAMTVEPL
jgi:ferrous iron transport protein A